MQEEKSALEQSVNEQTEGAKIAAAAHVVALAALTATHEESSAKHNE